MRERESRCKRDVPHDDNSQLTLQCNYPFDSDDFQGSIVHGKTRNAFHRHLCEQFGSLKSGPVETNELLDFSIDYIADP